MIKEKEGAVFSVVGENQPVPGCTISKSVYDSADHHLSHFTLAEKTDISAETYYYPKLIMMHQGTAEVYTGDDRHFILREGDSIITPAGIPVGIGSEAGAVYTELSLGKEQKMNPVLKDGNVFKLKDLVPYQEGKIVNMDLVSDPGMKFVLMSFTEGTGLAEHAAPGDALVFALDGEGVIIYEGKENPIKAGECFRFKKNGMHAVRVEGNFKMALLLTLE